MFYHTPDQLDLKIFLTPPMAKKNQYHTQTRDHS
jgi:hypothetical protein